LSSGKPAAIYAYDSAGAFTCNPVAYTGAKRLVEQECLDRTGPFEHPATKIHQVWHGQDGIEAHVRDRWFSERRLAQADPPESTSIEKCYFGYLSAIIGSKAEI